LGSIENFQLLLEQIRKTEEQKPIHIIDNNYLLYADLRFIHFEAFILRDWRLFLEIGVYS